MRYLLTTLCAFAVLTSAAIPAEGPLFDLPTNWPISFYSQGICTADFNNDNINDVAASNGDERIAVLMGNGDGSLQPAVFYNVGYDLGSIQAADLDKDGDIDLTVASSSYSVFTLKNNGDGIFQAPVETVISNGINKFILSDIDNDDDPDLIVSNSSYSSKSVTVLRNDGTGAFSSPATYSVGESPEGLCTGDFDMDNDIDLAVVTYFDSISVFMNDGTGSFGVPTRYYMGHFPQAIAAGDFDGDADLDLLVLNLAMPSAVQLLNNNGSGSFTLSGTYPTQSSIEDLLTADLDGDSDLDILITGDSLQVMFNNGLGAFGSSKEYWTGDYCYFAAIGRMDNNNSMDIAAIAYPYFYDDDPNAVSILLNKGNGTFPGAKRLGVMGSLSALCTSDIDKDGDPDLATATWWLGANHDTLCIMENDGDANFTIKNKYRINYQPWTIVPVDLNKDNFDDLAIGYSDDLGTAISVMINNGSGAFSGPVNYTVGANPRSIYASDFDNDGDNDLAVANAGSTFISILKNNGDGTFAAASNITLPFSPFGVSGGLINNDVFPDLVVHAGYKDSVLILTNNGTGGFTPADQFYVGHILVRVLAKDIDGDGDGDIITSGYNSNNVSVLLNDNFLGFNPPSMYPVCSEPISLTVSDFNNDALLDIAVENDGSYNISVLLNNGSGSFLPALSFGALSEDIESICAADFDGDGDNDIAVNDYDMGNILLLFNRTNMIVDVRESDDNGIIPERFTLNQNYPNPFNAATIIEYSVPARSHVSLIVYNLLGQRVITLVNETRPAGAYSVIWNGNDSHGRTLASGIYFYQLRIGDFARSRKAILLK